MAMQASARQQELERLYNARKGHVPHISISDDSHHITEAIGSYYGSEGEPTSLGVKVDNRPLSYMSGPSESRFTAMPPRSTSLGNRHPGVYESAERPAMLTRKSSERTTISLSPSETPSYKRLSDMIPDEMQRPSDTETAVQPFPLNDIDYESSPAAVAQELSNLQAIRRMSMNAGMADPDLPAFGAAVPGPPGHATSEDDPSKLFWVPARLHPELAPKEFKTFVEERVDKIRRRSGSEDVLSPDSLERTGSGASDLRRKKSMLSHSIDTGSNYEDGADRLERKRSKGMRVEGSTTIASLQDLEELVNDPSQLLRRMSIDYSRRSEDSLSDAPGDEDVILPTAQQGLKRSTRTTYRKGSLRRGERVPFSKRALNRQTENEGEPRNSQDDSTSFDAPILGLTRVRTEPIPDLPRFDEQASTSHAASHSPAQLPASYETTERPMHDDFDFEIPPPQDHQYDEQLEEQSRESQYIEPVQPPEPIPARSPKRQPREESPATQSLPPQHRQFQSRIASQGRTTAQLPGYTNTNPLPQLVETLPDGTKVAISMQSQQFPERKSSIETKGRQGAHGRPVPGRQQMPPSTTLDDISSKPSLLPGSGATRTDALTMVPTFEEKKVERKDSGRKSSWKWILGNDEDDKKSKKSGADDASIKSSKSGKLSKNEKARLDMLASAADNTTSVRPRESLVLDRNDFKIEDDRKNSKKSFDSSRKESKESGLLSAIFGSKKKSSDTDVKEKRRKNDRALSPEDLPPRILKADIDYNWTRFSILEERAIYRMAHIKLANPRRALHSQVLLSNFMYSYLAKVQMMHPQMQVPQQQSNQRDQQRQQQQQQQKKQETPPSEQQSYQTWQEQQQQEAAQQQMQYSGHGYNAGSERAYEEEEHAAYDAQHRSEHQDWPDYQTDAGPYDQQHSNRENGRHDNGYSVASGHDYLGYTKEQRSYNGNDHMWEDDEETEDLW